MAEASTRRDTSPGRRPEREPVPGSVPKVDRQGAGNSITPERAALVARVQELKATGLLQREIEAITGLSRSYVSDLLWDPDRSKMLARRATYAGKCVDCGSPTCGADGPALAPKRCESCANAFQREQKYWTEERIIAAIQTWAERRGKPPTASEWIRSVVDEDDYRYPARTSIYRSQAQSHAPFDKWADAIEAAGFPRPYTGSYKRKGEGRRMSNNIRTYLIFRVNDDDSLSLIGEKDSGTNAGAIEGFAPDRGTYASCPKGTLVQFDVAPRLVATRVEQGS